jgi:hypothetical protein
VKALENRINMILLLFTSMLFIFFVGCTQSKLDNKTATEFKSGNEEIPEVKR